MEALIKLMDRNFKRMNLGIIITIIIATAGMFFLTLYHPEAGKDATQSLTEALEKNRQADMKLVNAKLDSIRIDNRDFSEKYESNQEYYNRRLEENTKAINKNRNEKAIDYSNYNSVELQRAVSDLIRQYETTKLTNQNAFKDRR